MNRTHMEIIDRLAEDVEEKIDGLERMKDNSWDYDPSVSMKVGVIRTAMERLGAESDIQKACDAVSRAIDGLIDEYQALIDNLSDEYEDEDESEESEESEDVDYEPIDMTEECM